MLSQVPTSIIGRLHRIPHAVLASTDCPWADSRCIFGGQVTQLRELIAAAGSLPADRLKLLFKGKVLQDGDKAKWLKENGATLACTDLPPYHCRNCLALHGGALVILLKPKAITWRSACADTIVVVVAPLAPSSELSHMAAGTAPADEDEDDEVERFR